MDNPIVNHIIQETIKNSDHIKMAQELFSELAKSGAAREKYPDLYKELAHRMFSCSIDVITKEQRSYAKRICLVAQYSSCKN